MSCRHKTFCVPKAAIFHLRRCNDKGHIFHPQEKPPSTSTGGRGSRWVLYIGEGLGGCLPNLDHLYRPNQSNIGNHACATRGPSMWNIDIEQFWKLCVCILFHLLCFQTILNGKSLQKREFMDNIFRTHNCSMARAIHPGLHALNSSTQVMKLSDWLFDKGMFAAVKSDQTPARQNGDRGRAVDPAIADSVVKAEDC